MVSAAFTAAASCCKPAAKVESFDESSMISTSTLRLRSSGGMRLKTPAIVRSAL